MKNKKLKIKSNNILTTFMKNILKHADSSQFMFIMKQDYNQGDHYLGATNSDIAHGLSCETFEQQATFTMLSVYLKVKQGVQSPLITCKIFIENLSEE